ncbi:MAG: hypothetical protein J6D52_08090 [Clostridia bacterium]|nr:hypothetical protein [Clostridia bacterium]
MFVLLSKLKHEVIKTDNERKRDRLLELGYTLVEEKAPETDLDKMTDKQLEAYAKEHNIDLKDCKNKADKLAKIKEAESK